MRTRALKVALPVGSIPASINQGDTLLAGTLGFKSRVQICLTCVSSPAAQATYASVQTIRHSDTK